MMCTVHTVCMHRHVAVVVGTLNLKMGKGGLTNQLVDSGQPVNQPTDQLISGGGG